MNSIESHIHALVKDIIQDELPKHLAMIARENDETDRPVTLTINEMRKRYNIGRRQLVRLIESGDLPAVTRQFRGGKLGFVVSKDDADRVLAGIV